MVSILNELGYKDCYKGDATSLGLRKGTLKELRMLKVHSRQTDEDVIVELIKLFDGKHYVNLKGGDNRTAFERKNRITTQDDYLYG